MQISLEGKVAIVTGVSGDGQVGQAVAKALAENGAQLAICARKRSNRPKSCETQALVCSPWRGL
jgi:NAD(P)-dependent dehydrogenase (short-subunit alcohol dehydrogenase family)